MDGITSSCSGRVIIQQHVSVEKKEDLIYDLDKELFMRSYHIMAVKRHTRVIGVFVRLKARDGKDKYLKHIPNVWRLLESHLDEPYLADFKNWLDAVVPKEYRKIPSCLEN